MIGVGYENLPRAIAALNHGLERGLHIGAQVCVLHQGRTIADFAIGEARPGVAMTPDTLMIWLSSTKPVTAVTIGQLLDHGLLALDDAVAQYIPEFTYGGKDAVTIRQLLTHTAGFRLADVEGADIPWDEAIARICRVPLEKNWVPGERAGYHPNTSWYILGELVHRLDGRPFERYVREALFIPLGMEDCWIGLPEKQWNAYGDRIGVMFSTLRGAKEPANLTVETHVEACVPGSGGRGPMRQLAQFYEMLRQGGALAGRRILSESTVAEFTSPYRVGLFDETFQHRVDWGLGFIVDSKQYGKATIPYGFGDHASPRTFGHGGMQSSTSSCDPDNDLVVTAVFNGMPGEPKHNKRVREFNTAVYEDLGLA